MIRLIGRFYRLELPYCYQPAHKQSRRLPTVGAFFPCPQLTQVYPSVKVFVEVASTHQFAGG